MADARDRAILATAAAYVAAGRVLRDVQPVLLLRLRWLSGQVATPGPGRVELIRGRVPQVTDPPVFGAVERLVEARGRDLRAAELALEVTVASYFADRGADALRSLEPGPNTARALGLTGELVTDGEGEG